MENPNLSPSRYLECQLDRYHPYQKAGKKMELFEIPLYILSVF